MKSTFIGIFCLLILSCLASNSFSETAKIKEYVSPDKELKALVIPVPGKNGECRVEVYKSTGALLLSKSYTSEDGEHGSVIVQAKWTPDSNFFLYSMYSSGGHQPYSSPIDFYYKKDNTIWSLDEFVGEFIGDPEFNVERPDKVKVALTKFKDGGQVYFDKKLKLSELVERCDCLDNDTFTVHGRLTYSNGNPGRRIWIIGTKRMLGIRDGCPLPEYIQNKINWEVDIYGDFIVCPLTEYKPGEMQMVVVKSASHLVVK